MTKKSHRVAKARRALLALSLVMVTMMVAVGGTIAWLTADGGTVTNTFSVGDINIELKEHVYDPTVEGGLATGTTNSNENYKIVPGVNLPKDPFVIVKEKSEASWVFVKIEEKNWNENLTYRVNSTWTALGDNYPGIYYTEVAETNTDSNPIYILENNQVVVGNAIEKGEISNSAKPQLIFTAYACQKANVNDAVTAWDIINAASN